MMAPTGALVLRRTPVAGSEPASFLTNRSDELPLGVQLTWRLRAMFSTGELRSGEQLPSFRRLAQRADVNVNTVRGVYQSLEEEGLVVTHQGLGTFVAEEVEAAPCLGEIADEALSRAREAGFRPRDLAIVAFARASEGEAAASHRETIENSGRLCAIS